MRFHEVICLNYAGLPNVPLMRLVSGSEHSKQIALMDGDGSFVSTLSVDVKELMVVLALSFKSPLRLAPPGRVGEAWPVCVEPLHPSDFTKDDWQQFTQLAKAGLQNPFSQFELIPCQSLSAIGIAAQLASLIGNVGTFAREYSSHPSRNTTGMLLGFRRPLHCRSL